jgi:hypothetical protein
MTQNQIPTQLFIKVRWLTTVATMVGVALVLAATVYGVWQLRQLESKIESLNNEIESKKHELMDVTAKVDGAHAKIQAYNKVLENFFQTGKAEVHWSDDPQVRAHLIEICLTPMATAEPVPDRNDGRHWYKYSVWLSMPPNRDLANDITDAISEIHYEFVSEQWKLPEQKEPPTAQNDYRVSWPGWAPLDLVATVTLKNKEKLRLSIDTHAALNRQKVSSEGQ